MSFPNPTQCPICHKSNNTDSLTGRCTRCQPIRIDELPPDFQAYARSARFQKYKEFAVGALIGPVLIFIYFFYSAFSKSAPQGFLWLLIGGSVIFLGLSVRTLVRKKDLLTRYYRLAYVMQHGKPIDAEMQYEVVSGKSSSRRFFNVSQLAPGQTWPEGVSHRIEVDIPPRSEAKAVTYDPWKRFFEGFNPADKPKLWGKVYFDTDRSGSAVICIHDGLFLSVSENNAVKFSR